MKRIIGLSLIGAAVLMMVTETAEARFGRRRCRSCCVNQCQSGGCAPQGMAYGQDTYAAPPAGMAGSGPQPNTTFYRGSPDESFNNQGQPRTAPQVQGRTNLRGSVDQNGIRTNTDTQGAIEQNN